MEQEKTNVQKMLAFKSSIKNYLGCKVTFKYVTNESKTAVMKVSVMLKRELAMDVVKRGKECGVYVDSIWHEDGCSYMKVRFTEYRSL